MSDGMVEKNGRRFIVPGIWEWKRGLRTNERRVLVFCDGCFDGGGNGWNLKIKHF